MGGQDTQKSSGGDKDKSISKKTLNSNKIKTVLVLGDYDKDNTEQQMKLLSEAIKFIDEPMKYIVKPHPACRIVKSDYPEVEMTIVNTPISNLINDCSVVYSSSLTSAALDAHCFGKNVISVIDTTGLNLSPLRGVQGVVFVSSGKELSDALSNINELNKVKSHVSDFFNVDFLQINI